MRLILTLAFFFLMSGVSNVRGVFSPLPIPASDSPLAVRFDSYGGTSSKGEEVRLRRFAGELKKEDYGLKNAQGYIVSYGGRRTYAGEALRRAERARRYLIRGCGMAAGRLVTVDGGYREGWEIELYLVPPGAVPPVAAPTVDPGEVESISEERKGKRRRRAKP